MGASDDRDQTDDVVVHTTSDGEQIRVALADLPEAAVVESDVWDRSGAEVPPPVDPGGARHVTDVAVASPFVNDATDHTMEAIPIEIEGMKTVAGVPTFGAAALELRTQADGGPGVDSDVPTASASQLGRAPASMLEPHASPVPEISIEGSIVPAVEEDGPGFEEETRAVPEGELDGTTGVLSDLEGVHSRAQRKAPEPVELMVGGYRASRRLGEGGMAEVFLAAQPGSARPVVLKRLQKHLSEDPRQMKMFRREARIASGLVHPNIVQIIDFAEEGGSMFLVMEYLDGVDFRDLAARWWSTGRPLPIEVVVEVIAEAALGLDYAHAAPGDGGRPGNLVHRDISPENLFLTRQGQVKILDFGIARHGHERDDLTRTGEMKGKVPYMSPEQVAGDPLDGRSDLWSLTVVLYWLLTGHRPFDGATEFMTIKQIMERDPVPPAEVNDLVPHALNDVVLQGLSRDKAGRFARGQALHDALRALIAPLDDRKLGRAALGAEVAELPFPTREPVPYHPAAVPFARW